MKFRLVALDLDGTLLSSSGRISPRNLAALKHIYRRGVHVCIATGRRVSTAEQVTTAIDFPHTLISCNGALVMDRPENTIRERSYLDKPTIEAILTCFQSYHLTAYQEIVKEEPSAPGHPPFEGEPVTKVMARLPYDRRDELFAALRRDLPQCEVVRSTETLLEVMAKGVSKGKAVLRLARSLRIAPGEIIAFGDQNNDISMLEVAGLGVAMGNAADDAKQAADRMTAHHDDDGVALVLEELFELAS